MENVTIIMATRFRKSRRQRGSRSAAGVRSASTDKQAPEEEWDKPVSINTFGFEP